MPYCHATPGNHLRAGSLGAFVFYQLLWRPGACVTQERTQAARFPARGSLPGRSCKSTNRADHDPTISSPDTWQVHD